MRFGSVCSGIEAASVAWEPIGFKAAWLSEIEPFPSAVLQYHYPNVINLGDMTKLPNLVLHGDVEAPDILVGGTPCQAFSVAGLRNGLADERGQLTIKFVELADAIDNIRLRKGQYESIIVWENVPGVLSSKDNAFGCFLAGLCGESSELQPTGRKWSNSGVVYGPKRTVAWRILDAQYFGVAQRRRRVFVVASARSYFDPAAVLFEFDGMRRDTAPSREAWEKVTRDAGDGATFSSMQEPVGTLCARDYKGVGNQFFNEGKVIATHPPDVGNTLTARMHKGVNSTLDEGQSLVYPIHDQATRHNGCGGRGKGNGFGVGDKSDPSPTLTAGDKHAIAAYGFQPRIGRNGRGDMGDVCHALSAEAGITGKGDSAPCVASFAPAEVGLTMGASGPPYSRTGNERVESYALAITNMQVRRLTPTECERLQGFPDGYTQIPYRGKSIENCPDGPRYKALGNSMAVPVMRWIGNRIYESINKGGE